MGYALFTARKMSLQAKVNDYNTQLMKISNQQDQLTQQITAYQNKQNKIDNFQNMNGFQIGGAIIGTVFGGVAGAAAGSKIGGMVSTAVDMGQAAGGNTMLNALNAKQKQLDTEKQRIDTLLNKAQSELKSVESAEGKAIESATPKYVA